MLLSGSAKVLLSNLSAPRSKLISLASLFSYKSIEYSFPGLLDQKLAGQSVVSGKKGGKKKKHGFLPDSNL